MYTKKKRNQMPLITMKESYKCITNEEYSNVILSVFMYLSTMKQCALYICQINNSNYCNY